MAPPCSSPSVRSREDDRSATTKNHDYYIKIQAGSQGGHSKFTPCFPLGVLVSPSVPSVQVTSDASEVGTGSVFWRMARISAW